MRLDRFIQTQLAYSARTVRHLLAERKIFVNGIAVADGRQPVTEFCRIEAEGKMLQAREPVYIMLHKPRSCASATTDKKNPTVLDFIDRSSKQDLHLAGRLDFNSTGLLLVTNDGSWSRRITLPGRKIPKTYRVETKDEITEEYVNTFAEGIYFRFEDLTTLPATLTILAVNTAELTIHEGRYHQIKRMFGFFQNEVIGLHRLSIGNIVLDEKLAPGEYRPLTAEEIASVL
jgi:16S rRNA pseudouridine516 synthase